MKYFLAWNFVSSYYPTLKKLRNCKQIMPSLQHKSRMIFVFHTTSCLTAAAANILQTTMKSFICFSSSLQTGLSHHIVGKVLNIFKCAKMFEK